MLPSGSDMDAIVPALTELFSKALANGVSNIRRGTLLGRRCLLRVFARATASVCSLVST